MFCPDRRCLRVRKNPFHGASHPVALQKMPIRLCDGAAIRYHQNNSQGGA